MEKEFINGLVAKKPNDKTPWIKCKLSIKREELMTFLANKEGEWININICESKKDPSKLYAEVDNWKPTAEQKAKEEDEVRGYHYPTPEEKGLPAIDDLPF